MHFSMFRCSPLQNSFHSLLQSQPFFYTYKNSQEALEASAEFDVEEDSETERQSRFGAAQQDSYTETESDKPSGDQSATIATATVLTIAVVMGVAITIYGILAWRRRRPRHDYQNLVGRGEMD